MFRKPAVLLLIVLVFTVLTGCQANQPAATASDVEKIELLDVEGFTTTNPRILKTFNEPAQIEAILEAIENSEEIDGILDVSEPDYGLKLYYKNGETPIYFLWLEKSGANYYGMIMDADESHTGYTLTGNSAKILHNLIK